MQRRRPRSCPPSIGAADDELWVFPSEHPMRCGNPTKKYYLYDRSSPVADSISRMDAPLLDLKSLARRESRVSEGSAAPQSTQGSAQEGNSKTTPSSICRGCGEGDATKFSINSENFLVCECGIVACRADMGVNYTEVNESQARGEISRRDRGSGRRGSALAREEPEATVVSSEARRKQKLGHAPELANRESAGGMWELKGPEKKKLARAMEEVETILAELHPVHANVQRAVRGGTAALFVKAAKHTYVCTEHMCCMGFSKRPAKVVARISVVYIIEKACAGKGIDDVSTPNLVTLLQKIRQRPEFSAKETGAQNQEVVVAVGRIDSCAHPEVPCSPPAPPAARRPAAPPPKDADTPRGISRSSSECTVGGGGPIMQLRDEVHALAQHLKLPRRLRDSAVGLLQVPMLAEAMRGDDVVKGGASTKAYILLKSTAAAAGAADVGTPAAAGVSLGGDEVEELVKKMNEVLPPLSEATPDHDACLY